MARRILVLFCLVVATIPVGRAQAAPPLCFENVPNIRDCLQGRFAEYWTMNGGLPVFGYPITPVYDVITPTQTILAQVAERNRLEYHPQNQAPFDILLGRLGVDMLRNQGRDWASEPAGQPQPGCWYAEATRHTVCDQANGEGFLTFFRTHGLELGEPGVTEGESVSLWGYPLTEPAIERNAAGDTILTQWFERARFEYHPDNPPGSRVMLGLLGRELYDGGPPPVPSTRPIPDATGATPPPAAVVPPADDRQTTPPSERPVSALFRLVNDVHTGSGCAPLKYDGSLERAAQAHADDIARARRIDHTGSDGATLRTRLDRVGYPYIRASENIAVYPTPEDAFRVWMGDSPDEIHRVNMTSCQYTEAGIGRALDDAGGVWWVLDIAARQN